MLRPGSEARFQGAPPGELRPSATPFDEQERHANTCPDDDQIVPGVIREQLKRVDGCKDEGNPFCHNPQEQLCARIDGCKGNKNSKVQGLRTSENRPLPEPPNR